MKKYLALLLALVMVLSLCACGNSAPAATEALPLNPQPNPRLTISSLWLRPRANWSFTAPARKSTSPPPARISRSSTA